MFQAVPDDHSDFGTRPGHTCDSAVRFRVSSHFPLCSLPVTRIGPHVSVLHVLTLVTTQFFSLPVFGFLKANEIGLFIQLLTVQLCIHSFCLA